MKIAKNCFFGVFFRQNLGVWPPVVLRERVISWVFCTFCKWCNTYFKNNLHLGWFFIIRLVKMPKNTQNLTKKPKSQVFSLFQDPLGDKPKVRKFSKIFFYSSRCLLTKRFMKYGILMKFGFPAWYLGPKTWKKGPQGGKSRYAENSYQ